MIARKRVSSSQGTQLIDRSVAILDLLSVAGPAGMTSTEIGEAAGLKAPTARRIIAALESHSLIERGAKWRYRLGLRLLTLAAAASDRSGARDAARMSLMRLASETGDTAFLMVRQGFNTVCLDRQDGDYIIDTLTRQIGGEIPLGVAPASQAILAFLPVEEAELVLRHNAGRYGVFGNLTEEEIRTRLPTIRAQGFALDHGRLVEGISAVAVPIRATKHPVRASIAVNMTSARLPEKRVAEVVEALRREADLIVASLDPMGSL